MSKEAYDTALDDATMASSVFSINYSTVAIYGTISVDLPYVTAMTVIAVGFATLSIYLWTYRYSIIAMTLSGWSAHLTGNN